ncbi:MAG: ABC transporter ATP-binding protein [Planctomycetes bacterium]|nr:ABC transporter ATP-binding protein [Planctomycetota bacterium]
MSEAPAVALRGLTKAYGDRTVLRGIDLQVARGEVLGLVGPNGAGKSTLLRTLVGLVARSGGDVSVLGMDPAPNSLEVRHRTSYLPGETGVYLQMTGAQFLAFALGFHRRIDAARRDALLAGFELPLHARVRSYSAGMKQKLALVATLAPDVDLYLLDEPDRALDASVRLFLRDALVALRAAGKTIVLSSHHLAELETLADRLEFLHDGSLIAAQRLADARARLRRWTRVRLRAGAALPPSTHVERRERDGTLVVETEGDPLVWIRSLPADTFDAVECGTSRLEDLYRVLLYADRDDRGGAP